MKAFSHLFTTLDATTSTRDKLDALTQYFRTAQAADAAWAAYFLAGGKPRQVVPSRLLRSIAQTRAGLPEWLFDESYQAVGDLAETIAHILPPASQTTDIGLAEWIEARLLPLRGATPEVLTEKLIGYWDELDWAGRFLLTKLIGGGFRVGVSKLLVIRALGEVAGIDHKRIAHRMVGWTDARRQPSADRFLRLIAQDSATGNAGNPGTNAGNLTNAASTAHHSPSANNSPTLAIDTDTDTHDLAQDDLGLPYPFFLAHPLQAPPETLGEVDLWQAEWKWDGIRAQLVKRGGQIWLWSRGEELITERFPDITALASTLPDGTVLDGEILAWEPGATVPLPFARLQTRIARKTLTRKILTDSPARFLSYDLLEWRGEDIRTQPQSNRRTLLEQLAEALPAALTLSPRLTVQTWEALAALRLESRARSVEGLMLKRATAHYGVGRTRTTGEWWKWKIDPYTVDAVLLYAQHGHGRRASLYTDYTFALWSAPEDDPNRTLVPFTKAYSGLSDEEISRVDAIIRKTTLEKFGPVRSVKPTLLFEIAFEGIARSPRHKSGIAVRFPRMLRWRLDKPIEEADTLASLAALLDDAAAGVAMNNASVPT